MKLRRKINIIILLSLLVFFVICLIIGGIFNSEIIALGLTVPFVSVIINLFYKSWYNAVSHRYIENKSYLSATARIINVERYTVGSKWDRRYRTIIEFSDGYTYVSHKTDIDELFVYRKVYISYDLANEIKVDAWESHEKAVRRSNKRYYK